MEHNQRTNLVIVGGGAAGWLTAGILAAQHRLKHNPLLTITLIESPDVNILGVGEGTWPTMRDTLRKIGISESEFIRQCDASFKQGSKFVGWVSGQPQDVYYHPFVLPQGFFDTDMVSYWQHQHPNLPFADAVATQPSVCEHHKAPKQPATPEYAGVANYGYHLNASKFADLLKRHCVETLGVRHISDHVDGVIGDATGDIQALRTRKNGELRGDLFVDCSGFAALLIDKHYGVPFVDKKDVLFNDTALAVQVPYDSEQAPIASATIATAQQVGWIWDIGLPTRRGVGHVYSSAHSSQQEAEQRLRKYIVPAIGAQAAEQAELRKIPIRPGYRQEFWHHNCVAIGTSAGFLEPLEASALVMIELSASMLSDRLPATREMMAVEA